MVKDVNSDLQVLGSPHEFHFVHHALPHARNKRSIPHIRKLKADKRVSRGKVLILNSKTYV